MLSIAAAYAIGYAQVQPNASPVPDLVTHLLFVHTWFPDRYGTIDGVLWTLAVEVEFYCIFPLIWSCFRRSPWLTAGAMIAIAWIWRVALAQCCYDTLFAQWEENLPGYLDIFAFGMIAALLFVRFGERWRSSRATYVAPTVAIGGAVLLIELLESLYASASTTSGPASGRSTNRPLLGAAFLIIALGSLASPRWWQIVLDNAPLRFLATISYNLYLYHQLVARELLRASHSAFRRRSARRSRMAGAVYRVRVRLCDRARDAGDLRLRAPVAAAEAPGSELRQRYGERRLEDALRDAVDSRHAHFLALEAADRRPDPNDEREDPEDRHRAATGE